MYSSVCHGLKTPVNHLIHPFIPNKKNSSSRPICQLMVVVTIVIAVVFGCPQLQPKRGFKAIYPGHYEHRAGEWFGEAPALGSCPEDVG